jgi:pyridoxal phosphate enzyme (YggS family)
LSGVPDRLTGRLLAVRERIERSGRYPADVEIVAVTKGHPLATCRDALEHGLTILGENRVQEALPKLEALPDAEWHLIGHLQTNKVRHAAGRFALIQSVDSERLAEAIAQRHPGQAVLLEVNVAMEASKFGVDPDHAVDLALRVAARLDLRGLMAIGPRHSDPAPAFAELRRLRDEAEQRLGRPLSVLSMGMSDDFEAALDAGSTMLRLGRVLFG